MKNCIKKTRVLWNLGNRALDQMCHTKGIFPCSQDSDLVEEQMITRARYCLWTVPVLTAREKWS